MKYQVEVNREECIRCGSCYGLDSTHFEGDSDGKSQVIGGTTNGKSVGTFDDNKIVEAQAAADVCPVSAITVTEKK
ncbi:MAG TPA: ferredoxin [Candidatus Nanoarchaeia archaeon]|nr:ferredoxin [Candidatus Nanoarchaeia archaeon]